MTECDRCGATSPIYTRWRACGTCRQHICPSCWAPGGEHDDTGDDPYGVAWHEDLVTCLDCDAKKAVSA